MASGSADSPTAPPTGATEGSGRDLRVGYFPAAEGLRALAAVAVLLYHVVTNMGADATGALYEPAAVLDMGVSVFFVLSGFLIYRPFAAASIGRGTVPGLRRFWWRRLLRIVPAYWAALSIMWLLGWVEVGDRPWRLYLFVQVYDPYTTLQGIVPAWSLNAEVAFYLLVPIWAAVVRRLARGRVGVELAAVGLLFASGYASRAAFSATERVWAVTPAGDAVTLRAVAFTWLPNQIDLFALGMAFAVVSVAATDDRLRARLDRWAAPAGLWWAGAVAAWLAYAYGWGESSLAEGHGSAWQIRAAAFGLVGLTLMVPVVFGSGGVVRGALHVRPVAWVGTVSYGLYLWHLDLLQELPGWFGRPLAEYPLVALTGLTLLLGLLAAAASWYGLERPLASLRGTPPVPVIEGTVGDGVAGAGDVRGTDPALT